MHLCISWRVCQRYLVHPWGVIFKCIYFVYRFPYVVDFSVMTGFLPIQLHVVRRQGHGWLSKFCSESTLNLDSVFLQFNQKLSKWNSKVLLRSLLYVYSFTVLFVFFYVKCDVIHLIRNHEIRDMIYFSIFFVRWLYSILDFISFTCQADRHFNFVESLITT